MTGSRTKHGEPAFLLISSLVFVLFLAALFSPYREPHTPLFFSIFYDPSPVFHLMEWDILNVEHLRGATLPLWNFHQGAGAPLIGNYLSSPFFPLKIILYLFPYWVSFDFYLAARFFILFLGALIYFRRRLDRPSALACAAAFAGSGYFLGLFNMNHLDVEMLIPWLFTAIENDSEQRSTGSVIPIVLITSLSFLGGQPTAAFYLVAAGAAYFVAVSRRGFVRSLSAAAIIFGLIPATAAAVMMLPFGEFASRAVTWHPAGFGGLSLDLRNAVSLVSPWMLFRDSHDFFTFPIERLGGTPATLTNYIAQKYSIPKIPFSVGVVAVLFAGASFGGIFRSRRTIFFVAGVVVVGTLIFGLPPGSLVTALPGVSMLTNVKYVFPIFTFSVVVLAAEGIAAIGSNRRALLGSAAFVAVWLVGSFLFYRTSMRPDAVVNHGPSVVALITALAVLIGAVAAGSLRPLGMLLPVLVAAEIVIAAQGLRPTALVRFADASGDIADIRRTDLPIEVRSLDEALRMPGVWHRLPLPSPTLARSGRIVDRSGMIPPNLMILGGASSPSVQDALTYRPYFRYLAMLDRSESGWDIWERFLLRYEFPVDRPESLVARPLAVAGEFSLDRSGQLALRRFPDAPPFVESEARKGCDDSNTVSSAPRVNFEPNGLSFTPSSAGFYRIGAVDYPGFRATVGGRPAPIEKADGPFMGVRVPQGGEQVRIDYRPSSVFVGLAASIATWLVLIALAMVRGKEDRP